MRWNRPGRVAAVVAAVALGGSSPGAGQAAGVPAAPIVAFERELAADVARDSVGSVAAAVFAGDRVVWRGAFGWSRPETRTLATPATLYRAGSVTKIVTALVLLRLVESGDIALDDPVARYLPEIRRL